VLYRNARLNDTLSYRQHIVAIISKTENTKYGVMARCYSTRQHAVRLTHACAVVPKEGGGEAGYDIIVMFSPGSAIRL
jgi:hypothetical protein